MLLTSLSEKTTSINRRRRRRPRRRGRRSFFPFLLRTHTKRRKIARAGKDSCGICGRGHAVGGARAHVSSNETSSFEKQKAVFHSQSLCLSVGSVFSSVFHFLTLNTVPFAVYLFAAALRFSVGECLITGCVFESHPYWVTELSVCVFHVENKRLF